jgi:hypothetical protein
MALPTDVALSNPVAVTSAMPGLSELQVPPDGRPVSAAVLPAHKPVGASIEVTEGRTVAVAEDEQPLGKVYVNVVSPGLCAVTMPDVGSTDRVAGLAEDHAPPVIPEIESAPDMPSQSVSDPPMVPGRGLTVSELVA